MDRAARNFLALAAITLILAAYGLCALIGYGILPLLEGRTESQGLALLAVLGLGTLLTVSIHLGAQTLRREVATARALSRRIDAAALPQPATLRLVAGEAGLSGRVSLIDSPESCSFVYGAPAPRVVLSSGLLSRLSTNELRAALEHERYHVQSLDPLRSAVAGAAVDAMFFLPALRTLQRRYEAARELAADRHAVKVVGRRPLAGALLKAMEGVAAEQPATIPLAAPRLIDFRLTQLETGREPRLTGIERRSIGATALGALAFLILLMGAPLAVGGSASLARELGPASLLQGAAVCLLPLAATAAMLYRRAATQKAIAFASKKTSPPEAELFQ